MINPSQTSNTYSAAITVRATVGDELAVLVLARATEITLDLNCEVECRIGGWFVWHDGDESPGAGGTDTKIDRSIVAPRLAWRSPLATI